MPNTNSNPKPDPDFCSIFGPGSFFRFFFYVESPNSVAGLGANCCCAYFTATKHSLSSLQLASLHDPLKRTEDNKNIARRDWAYTDNMIIIAIMFIILIKVSWSEGWWWLNNNDANNMSDNYSSNYKSNDYDQHWLWIMNWEFQSYICKYLFVIFSLQ